MKVLILHNSYQIKGGEDAVVSAEYQMLKNRGIDVELFLVNNDCIRSPFQKVLAGLQTIFSFSAYFRFKSIIKEKSPDIVHVHNYFPLISPSVVYACRSLKTPVVLTLHNYRTVCPTALLMLDGRIEERSLSGSVWWAVKQRVYRGSLAATFALCAMIEVHKKLGTWKKSGVYFIALTQFAKAKYLQAGFVKERLFVKPNFCELPMQRSVGEPKEKYALFVGRLSPEKGIDVLLQAWASVNYELRIIGDGNIEEYSAMAPHNVKFLGQQPKEVVFDNLAGAKFLVLPSLCYEGFPMVLAESFSMGIPVLVSDIGSMKEIVEDGIQGFHFKAGSAQSLAEKANIFFADSQKSKNMSVQALDTYRQKYSENRNFEMLEKIYQSAISDVL